MSNDSSWPEVIGRRLGGGLTGDFRPEGDGRFASKRPVSAVDFDIERPGYFAMRAQHFDELFNDVVARPLEADGFQKQGKNLFGGDANCQFAWIRGGGRLSGPGEVAHIVCFRHSFLRGKSESQPTGIPRDPGDYPWVFSCENLIDSKPSEWVFDPARLMAPPFGRLVYSDLSVDEAVTWLDARRSAFLQYVAWARKLPLTTAHSQIATYVKDYWIARLWDEDYRAHLKA